MAVRAGWRILHSRTPWGHASYCSSFVVSQCHTAARPCAPLPPQHDGPVLMRLYSECDDGKSRLSALDFTSESPLSHPMLLQNEMPGLLEIPTSTMAVDALDTPEEGTWAPGKRLDVFHRCSRRQWVFVLSGGMWIHPGLGEPVLLRRGDCLLAEDVAGSGHRTAAEGSLGRCVIMRVPLHEQDPSACSLATANF